MSIVLVVDDEIEACNVLDEFLSSKGHEVHTAYDGDTAIEKIKGAKPHLVLLDMIMPGMHGIEVLREIQNIDPMVKVVMVTVVTDEEQACETFEYGAYDYITKPVDLSRLEAVLLATTLDSST